METQKETQYRWMQAGRIIDGELRYLAITSGDEYDDQLPLSDLLFSTQQQAITAVVDAEWGWTVHDVEGCVIVRQETTFISTPFPIDKSGK